MIASVLTILFFLCIYFMPFAIGNHRHMRSQGALFTCNLLFGWTVLGWFMCLLWAFMGQSQGAYMREIAQIVAAAQAQTTPAPLASMPAAAPAPTAPPMQSAGSTRLQRALDEWGIT
ncbi:MAG: superinfection immunity protein [Acidobacteriaceae bacterium]